MKDIHFIMMMLDEMELNINKYKRFNGRATICFDVNPECIDGFKEMLSLSIKINPIKDEYLKLSFDWGVLEVKIYCYK